MKKPSHHLKNRHNLPETLSRNLAEETFEEIEAIIKKFFKEKGWNPPRFAASFGPTDGNMKLSIKWIYPIKRNKGKDIDAVNFDRYAPRYGLSKSDLGKRLNFDGEEYEIIGMTNRGSVIAKKDGKKWRIKPNLVKMKLKNQQKGIL